MDTVHVYDTWVKGKNGKLHFDVMTTSEEQALTLAKQYLVGRGNRTRSSPSRNANSAIANHSPCFRKRSSGSSANKAGSSCPCQRDRIYCELRRAIFLEDRSIIGMLFEGEVKNQKNHSDGNCRVGHIESRPMVAADVEVEKVDHLSVAEPVQ